MGVYISTPKAKNIQIVFGLPYTYKVLNAPQELWDRDRDPFFDLDTVEAVTMAVLDGVRPPIDEKKIPSPIASLIKSCWADDPADRSVPVYNTPHH